MDLESYFFIVYNTEWERYRPWEGPLHKGFATRNEAKKYQRERYLATANFHTLERIDVLNPRGSTTSLF